MPCTQSSCLFSISSGEEVFAKSSLTLDSCFIPILIKKYIFPGSCLISVAQISDVIKEYTDLAIVDMEDITKHYAETLNRWKTNFIKVIPEVKKMGFSEAFIKMWEFYFVFCEAGFLERNIGDVQLVFSKSGARDIDIRY